MLKVCDLKESYKYSYSDLNRKFQFDSPKETIAVIKKLKELNIIKTVKRSDVEFDFQEIEMDRQTIYDVNPVDSDICYVCSFVGVIIVANRVLKCYPKYLNNKSSKENELIQILSVLYKLNSKEQIINLYNGYGENQYFNLLAIMIYILNDYYEYGIYTNNKQQIEVNGLGEVLWDKTINETFAIISNNRPIYPDLFTRKSITDTSSFFQKLHEIILTKISKELLIGNLLDLFSLSPVELSLDDIELLGTIEYIKYKIEKQIDIEFNTRKQNLLKAIYAYLCHSGKLSDSDNISLFGTNSFHVVWEKVCAEVLDNQLNKKLDKLELPVPLNKNEYDSCQRLINLIEKPYWSICNCCAQDTLIPDIVSIGFYGGSSVFCIFDAKYYSPTLENGSPPKKQPGIESIAKQYLYQLAYSDFISQHKFDEVCNCFLFPTEDESILDGGIVSMKMFKNNFGLKDIKIRYLPTTIVYQNYLTNKKILLECLKLTEI